MATLANTHTGPCGLKRRTKQRFCFPLRIFRQLTAIVSGYFLPSFLMRQLSGDVHLSTWHFCVKPPKMKVVHLSSIYVVGLNTIYKVKSQHKKNAFFLNRKSLKNPTDFSSRPDRICVKDGYNPGKWIIRLPIEGDNSLYLLNMDHTAFNWSTSLEMKNQSYIEIWHITLYRISKILHSSNFV